MVISVSRQEDEATLAWLKGELERADNRGQAKLADLLVAVRDDIRLELKLTEASLDRC
jgi:hypothetical protein